MESGLYYCRGLEVLAFGIEKWPAKSSRKTDVNYGAIIYAWFCKIHRIDNFPFNIPQLSIMGCKIGENSIAMLDVWRVAGG